MSDSGKTNQNNFEQVGSFGIRKSKFNAQQTIESTDTFDFVRSGTNFKVTFEDLVNNLGVSGTIVSNGESGTTPVLDKAGSVNTIRNLKEGSGIGLALSPENSIEISTAFTVDTTGAPVFNEATSPTTVRSIVGASGGGIDVGFDSGTIQLSLSSGGSATGKTIQVNSMSDFPDPVGGVITLSGDTSYQINNDLTTSNRFVLGDRTSLRGLGSAITTLEYTGTATMFTSSDNSNSLNECRFSAPNGTVLDWENTAGNEGVNSFTVDRCLIDCDVFGTFDSGGTFFIFASTVICNTNGILIEGTGIDVVQLSVARGSQINAGTLIDFGSAVITSPSVVNAEITVTASATAISGLTNSGNVATGGIGRIAAVTFLGDGTPIVGIDSTDSQWEFSACVPIQNSRTNSLIYTNGNALDTVIDTVNTPVKVNAVFTEQTASRMTTDSTGTVTYSPESPADLSVTVNLTFSPSAGSDTIAAYIAINGTVISETETRADTSAGEPTSRGIVWQETFNQGDTIEVWVENQDDTTDIVVEDCVIRVN